MLILYNIQYFKLLNKKLRSFLYNYFAEMNSAKNKLTCYFIIFRSTLPSFFLTKVVTGVFLNGTLLYFIYP